MVSYRMYSVDDRTGGFIDVEAFDETNDDTALARIRASTGTGFVELWSGARFVGERKLPIPNRASPSGPFTPTR
jgi:hypothetical protein